MYGMRVFDIYGELMLEFYGSLHSCLLSVAEVETYYEFSEIVIKPAADWRDYE